MTEPPTGARRPASHRGDSAPLVAVLDYGIGNLRSAQKALEWMGADAHLTADAGLIADAAGVVLPGVGNFGRCMEALRHAGLADIAAAAATDERPFLGICVGLQMLVEGSDESPDVGGLGVLPGRVERLAAGVKHPQMQWNTLTWRRRPALATDVGDPAWLYFVHSYAVRTDDDLVLATCDYGGEVVAMVGRGRCWAMQFHPEKSAAAGLALLGGFVAECRSPTVALDP